jgi:hypothetical protein
MKPPLHKPCGTEHWSSQRGPASTTVRQPCPQDISPNGQKPEVARKARAGDVPPSSSGRTTDFDSVKRGSNPRGGTKCAGTTTAKAKKSSPPGNAPKSPAASAPRAARRGTTAKPTSATSAGNGILGTSRKDDGCSLTSRPHPRGPKVRRKELSKASLETVALEVVPDDAIVVKVDRKTYLKLKARDRRKRERAEADKLRITVAEYRVTKAKRHRAKSKKE